MSNSKSITDFKDLRKAIEEIQKNKPAKTRYQQQAEKMNYMQEAADEKDDKKDSGLLKRKDHAGEEEIKKAYLALGTEAQGSVEYQRGLIQKELAKMGYKTYSKYAFDSIFKFENNTMGLKESAFDDMKHIVKTKGAKKVGGVMVDMFTASVITQAYDKVNDANKKKMEKANVQTLVKLAQKVMGMKEELKLDEGKMSDLLIDIQQGASAKELSKTFNIPLSVAKEFLKDYYGQKKGSRKEETDLDEFGSRNMSAADKANLRNRLKNKKKGKKEEVEEGSFWGQDKMASAIDKKQAKTHVRLTRNKGGYERATVPKKDKKKIAQLKKDGYKIDTTFGESLEEVQEGTWAIPKTSKEKKLLKDLMKKPIPLGKDGDSAIDRIAALIGDDSLLDDLNSAGKKNPNTDARPIIQKAMKRLGIKEEVSREDQLKEERTHAKQSPFKLKSQQYPRAVAIDTKGFGKRHATEIDITEACDSFGMITEQELQIEQIQKQLGKLGFISYNSNDLQEVFDDRETQRMIYALESIVEEQTPIEYRKEQIEDSYIMSREVEFVKPDGQKTAGPVLKLCENTFNVKDKYTGKSFTYKYINEENKVKTFNQVINEGKFSKKLVRMAGGIAFDKRYVGGNMTGATNAIEKLKKGLSDDPEVRKMLRLANESFNSPFFNEMETEDQEAYVKFFNAAMKKFGISSPSELDDKKKKEFFNYIDKNYTAADEEVKEGKFAKYSDLLVKKAKLVAQGPIASKEVAAINKQIAAEMKKLGVKESMEESEPQITHKCATHVEHAVFGSGETVSGQHTLVMSDSGDYVVSHYDVNFDHGIEEMVSVGALSVTKQEDHSHAMAKKAGRKKLKAGWKKEDKIRIDGRRKNFREKMIKLGYIKGR